MRFEVSLAVGTLIGTLALALDAHGLHLTWTAFELHDHVEPRFHPEPEYLALRRHEILA